MGHGHGEWKDVRNPGPLAGAGKLKTVFLALIVLGFGAFAAGLAMEPKRAWFSFLMGHFYFMSLAIGGLFFAVLQWLTGAMWSAPIRRIAEAFSAYLPVALVSFLVLYFGLHDLYIWTHPDHVTGDIVLEHKEAYLSIPFFMIRNIIAMVIWIAFARFMVGNSLKQDKSHDLQLTHANQKWAPIFMIFFGVSYTMVAFDLLMSLDPHWFSTMYGVYCFSGLFYSVIALTTLIAIWLKRRGSLDGIANANHFHDLGKFMFAFSVFWAYIGFSQFMLIWYANLPEETGYFIKRFDGAWLWMSVALIAKFIVPFFWLLPREAKRDETTLTRAAIFMLLAQVFDLFWLVGPEFSPTGPVYGWLELGTFLGFAGVFGTVVLTFLGKTNVVAIGDPRLKEAVNAHDQ